VNRVSFPVLSYTSEEQKIKCEGFNWDTRTFGRISPQSEAFGQEFRTKIIEEGFEKKTSARSVTRTRDLQISQEIKDASYKSPYESGAPTD
jgi:hypothetical protein